MLLNLMSCFLHSYWNLFCCNVFFNASTIEDMIKDKPVQCKNVPIIDARDSSGTAKLLLNDEGRVLEAEMVQFRP